MSSGASAPEVGSLIAAVVPLVPAWRVDRAFDYLVPEELADRVRRGSLVRARFGGRRVRGVVVGLGEAEPDRPLEPLAAVVLDDPVAPPPHDELLDWIARRYATPRGVVFARAVPSRVRAGHVVVRRPEAAMRGASGGSALSAYEGGPDLLEALGSGRAGTWVLRPSPTDDRGDLIAGLVAAPRGQVLVAVPEVRYGSSVLDALAYRFDHLARLDTARPEAERAAGWRAMAGGHALGAGGRATVLVPAPELRLIVLDEEHHTSYREDRWPRYDARRVAVERAALQGAICVLVSSTPTVESGAAAARGSFGSVHRDRTAERAARPIVETVPAPETRTLSRDLYERMRDALAAGGRCALLVPRRGYARAVWCAECRRSLRCPRCEAGLFFDRDRRRVRCARCGFATGAPDACPACGGTDFRYIGAGSERFAEQLAKTFPRARVVRADPETLAAGETRGAEEADIYVTTWIGTKPALRPDVSLVGVLDADALIRRPDFRAAEHAYQALSAMAEWAGPAERGGRLLIQCSEPGHHSVQAVVRADYAFFLERELEHRRELSYPPFAELVRVSARGEGAGGLIERAAAAARSASGRVLGPIAVADGLQVLVKCSEAVQVAEALRPLLEAPPAGGRLRVDVDPR